MPIFDTRKEKLMRVLDFLGGWETWGRLSDYALAR
jgi:hypothetical protein